MKLGISKIKYLLPLKHVFLLVVMNENYDKTNNEMEKENDEHL